MLLESTQAMIWSVPCRFGAGDDVKRLCGMPSAGPCSTPRTGPSRARRGAESAVFRPPRGRRRADPRPARAPGYPSRSSRLGLGHWTWLYGEFRLITVRCAKSEHLCPTYSHNYSSPPAGYCVCPLSPQKEPHSSLGTVYLLTVIQQGQKNLRELLHTFPEYTVCR